MIGSGCGLSQKVLDWYNNKLLVVKTCGYWGFGGTIGTIGKLLASKLEFVGSNPDMEIYFSFFII